MANLSAGLEFRKDNGVNGRRLLITKDITAATTIQGGVNGIWNISAAVAGFDVLVADYDASHYGDYPTPPTKPMIVIKCSADCSVQNVTVSNSAGVLYTFAADYSVTPRYVVLDLDAPTAGSNLWKLA